MTKGLEILLILSLLPAYHGLQADASEKTIFALGAFPCTRRTWRTQREPLTTYA